MTYSDTNLTIDELMEDLKEPLPLITEVINIGGVKNPSPVDETSTKNSFETKATSSPVKKKSKTSIGSNEFSKMTMTERLEHFKCKCEELENKSYVNKTRAPRKHVGNFKKLIPPVQRAEDKEFENKDYVSKTEETLLDVPLSTSEYTQPTSKHEENHPFTDMGQEYTESDYKFYEDNPSSTNHSSTNPSSTIASSTIPSAGSDYTQSTSEDKKESLIMQAAQDPKIKESCKQYSGFKENVLSFINDLLIDAEEGANNQLHTYSVEDVQYGEDYEIPVVETTTEEVLTPPVEQWVSHLRIQDFNPKNGRKLISSLIHHTWHLERKWFYCIDYITKQSDTCTDIYIYEVKWSLPNKNYPIPQVVIKVFFTIEVSRVQPKECPVKVAYNFETERYKFTPDDDIDQEKFLENIMQCKLNFFKSSRI